MNKCAADNGAVGVLARGLKSIAVGDAEADQSGISQLHGRYSFKIRQLPVGDALLSPGNRRIRYHIYEAPAQFVNFADALFVGLGGEEETDAQVVLLKKRFVIALVFVQGQIGQDEPVDAHFFAGFDKKFFPVLHHLVEIPHQNQRGVAKAARFGNLFKQKRKGHPILEGYLAALLNSRPVGQGVGIGYAHFDEVDARLVECADDLHGVVTMRIPSREINIEHMALFIRKKSIYSVHNQTIRNSQFAIRHSKFEIRNSSFVIRNSNIRLQILIPAPRQADHHHIVGRKAQAIQSSQGMGGFQCGNNAFVLGQEKSGF